MAPIAPPLSAEPLSERQQRILWAAIRLAIRFGGQPGACPLCGRPRPAQRQGACPLCASALDDTPEAVAALAELRRGFEEDSDPC